MDSKEEQIITLLKGNPLQYACKILGVKEMDKEKYSKVFTVSKDEILEYVKKNGIPQDYSTSRYSLTEGFKFFQEDGKWYCCFKEVEGCCY